MATEFGWWNNNEEEGKYQVVAEVHGGNISWTRKQGHHTCWATHKPTTEDWERLLAEASKRVPRRLISPKQYDVIKRVYDMR